MKKKPDIGILYPNYFPEDFGEMVTEDIRHEKLNLYLKREEPKIWSSIEWAIPGVITAYILKPYFESFLKEAGKDHYNLLKTSLSKLLRFNKDAPIETTSTSPNKLNKNNTQSKAISIHIEIKDERKIKLLFDNELDIDDWIGSLEDMMDKIQRNYSDYPDDELTLKLKTLEKDLRLELFAIINKETKEWEFFDLMGITNYKLKREERK